MLLRLALGVEAIACELAATDVDEDSCTGMLWVVRKSSAGTSCLVVVRDEYDTRLDQYGFLDSVVND